MAHILVQSHAHRLGEVCSAVPFSWRIRDYVEDLWVQAQYISEPAGARPHMTSQQGPGLGSVSGHASTGPASGRLSGSLLSRRRQAVLSHTEWSAVSVPGKPGFFFVCLFNIFY